MVGNLRRNTLKKCLHLCRNIVDAIHDSRIDYISGNYFFSRKAGYSVDTNDFTRILALVVQTSHRKFQTFSRTRTDLKIVTLTYLIADCFIHLSATDWNFPGNDDLAVSNDRKLRALCADINNHASRIFIKIHSHGNRICDRGFHHIYFVLTEPVSVRHMVVCPFFDSRHIKWYRKKHIGTDTEKTVNFFHHTVQCNFLQFQIGNHTKSHRRINYDISRCFFKHIVRFIAHGDDPASL